MSPPNGRSSNGQLLYCSLRCGCWLAMIALLLVAAPARADCPPCGPDFCQSDPRIAPALAQRKRALKSAGYPDRLIGLVDKGDQCYASITRAPDRFTMW